MASLRQDLATAQAARRQGAGGQAEPSQGTDGQEAAAVAPADMQLELGQGAGDLAPSIARSEADTDTLPPCQPEPVPETGGEAESKHSVITGSMRLNEVRSIIDAVEANTAASKVEQSMDMPLTKEHLNTSRACSLPWTTT